MRSASSPRAVSMITGSSDVEPDPAAQLEAVRSGEHHVEHDEVGRASSERVACGVAVAGLERAVPLALEIADDDLAHDRLIVDDEHGLHLRSVPRMARDGSPRPERRTSRRRCRRGRCSEDRRGTRTRAGPGM